MNKKAIIAGVVVMVIGLFCGATELDFGTIVIMEIVSFGIGYISMVLAERSMEKEEEKKAAQKETPEQYRARMLKEGNTKYRSKYLKYSDDMLLSEHTRLVKLNTQAMLGNTAGLTPEYMHEQHLKMAVVNDIMEERNKNK